MSTISRRSTKCDSVRHLRSAQLEEQLVRRRQAESERQNFWSSNSTYFKVWDFNTALHSNWASRNPSSESLQKLQSAKKKQETLQKRRENLKELLEVEDAVFREALEKQKRKTVLLEDMNAANIELLLREEEARRKERDIKMHHYWRQNQPCFRDFERQQHSDYVKRSWLQQVVEKRKEKEMEEKKMLQHLEELKRMQEIHEAKEKELLEDRKRSEMELRAFLEKQMELVKCKEKQEKILKSEELETVRLQQELEDMLEERRKLEEKRKNIDLSLFHRRQYQLLLKRRAIEIQTNLEADKKFLDKIAAEKKFEASVNAERVAQYKKDLEIAREICKKQTEIEKIRTSQAQYLFDEEAKKMYEDQETQWQMESKAREKLMNEVLKTLQFQVQEKLLENIRNQEENKRSREEILKEVEIANKEFEQLQERTKKSIDNWKKDLDQQILEKKLETYYRKKKQEEDKENELKAKREEEEKLCRELSKMYLSGYQPKNKGRKKFTLT